MHIFVVPVYLYVLPFLLLLALLKCVNWLIKKGNALRPLALILSLTMGGLWILGGILLLTTVGIIIFSITVIFTGGLCILIALFRILFVSKQKIIDDEIQDKIAEEKRKIEDKNYESYEWLCQESRKILDSGKIEDYLKFRRLIDVLDNNRSYPELKELSKELKALEQKGNEEIFKRMRGGTTGY